MKYFENYSSFTKKNTDYKLLAGHKRILKKYNLDSSLLNVKAIPIIGIYKFIKILDNLPEEKLMSIILYILSYKLHISADKTKKLGSDLQLEIPNFESLVKKFTLVLNTLLMICNMVFKKDGLVIGSLGQMLNLKIILKVLDLISDFCTEQNLGLQKFIYLIYEKDDEVLKSIVEFVEKETRDNYIEGLLPEENVTESINYNFKTDYDSYRFKKHLDIVNNSKVGDILDNETIYLYVEYLVMYGEKQDYDNCFVDGNLGDRIDEYDRYKLKEIPISKLNLEEWDLDDSYVDIYKGKFLQNKDYPPIVIDDEYSIIDGLHRTVALKESGLEKIMAFVGI